MNEKIPFKIYYNNLNIIIIVQLVFYPKKGVIGIFLSLKIEILAVFRP